MIETAIRQIFNATDGDEAEARLDEVVGRLRAPATKVAQLLDDAEAKFREPPDSAEAIEPRQSANNP